MFTPNYDESKVPTYTLPDPLRMSDGTPVTDSATWQTARRAELLKLFRTHVYGHMPLGRPQAMRFEMLDDTPNALDGRAIRRQVQVTFSDEPDGPSMEILLYLPRGADEPVPVFVGLNFHGNHTVHRDPAIRLSRRWMRSGAEGAVDNCATEAARGTAAQRWPIEQIVERGYGVATIYYGDLARDDADTCFGQDVFRLFFRPDQTRPDPDQCGTIGVWAWGLSRAMDYLETDPAVDSRRVMAMGHSRLGKTALWAAAQDERFAGVISNQSGCLGATISRRCFGETVGRITTRFPHWFCAKAAAYTDREQEMPVDQHELIALQAPRPVLVCSAQEDLWADPRGEFLGALGADPVYRLLGTEGLAMRDMPAVNQPVFSRIGYHIRPGKHGVIPEDWKIFMDFADRHLRQ